MNKSIFMVVVLAVFLYGCASQTLKECDPPACLEDGMDVSLASESVKSEKKQLNQIESSENWYDDMIQFNKARRLRNVELCKPIINETKRESCVASITKDFSYCDPLILDEDWEISCANNLKALNLGQSDEQISQKCHDFAYQPFNDCILSTAQLSSTGPADLVFCDKITIGEFAPSQKIYCRAVTLEDVKVCEGIEESWSVAGCVMSVVAKTGDIQICEQYDFSLLKNAPEEKDRCYLNVVSRTDDKDICNKIEDEKIKKNCEEIQ